MVLKGLNLILRAGFCIFWDARYVETEVPAGEGGLRGYVPTGISLWNRGILLQNRSEHCFTFEEEDGNELVPCAGNLD